MNSIKKMVKITLRINNKNQTIVDADEYTTIYQLKKEVQVKFNIHPNYQTFYKNGIKLDDQDTLDDLGIITNDILFVITRIEQTITLKMINKLTITLQVTANTKILDLKEQVQKQLCIIPDRQRIIYAGRQLLNDENLDELDINNSTVLHLVFKKEDDYWAKNIEELLDEKDNNSSRIAAYEQKFSDFKSYISELEETIKEYKQQVEAGKPPIPKTKPPIKTEKQKKPTLPLPRHPKSNNQEHQQDVEELISEAFNRATEEAKEKGIKYDNSLTRNYPLRAQKDSYADLDQIDTLVSPNVKMLGEQETNTYLNKTEQLLQGYEIDNKFMEAVREFDDNHSEITRVPEDTFSSTFESHHKNVDDFENISLNSENDDEEKTKYNSINEFLYGC